MESITNNGENQKNVVYIYWVSMAITALTPLIIFIVSILRRPSMINMLRAPLRYRSYGLRNLERHGQIKYSMFYIFCYRHRPMFMDCIKVAAEVSLIVYFLDDTMPLRGSLIWWCVYDIVVVIYWVNIRDLKMQSRAGTGVKMAYWIYLVYTAAYGFPMGTAAKILFIFNLEGDIDFHYIFSPYYFGCLILFLVTIFYLVPVSCIKAYKRDHWVEETSNRVYLSVLSITLFVLWLWVFFTVEFCNSPIHLTMGNTWVDLKSCSVELESYTAAFLPLSVQQIFFNIYLSWAAIQSGILWRFLPEVITLWAASISFLTAMYHNDKDNSTILLGAVIVLVVSCLVTLVCNISLMYVIVYTVRYIIPNREREIAEGRRSRHFTADDRKKNRENREQLLLEFFKSKGGIIDTTQHVNTHKERARKSQTLKGTIFKKLWVQNEDQMTRCCICFEDYTGEKDAIVLAIIKKCGHYFHYDCVWDWLEKRPTCPVCRQPVDLNDTGIRVLSYTDIKTAIRRNKRTTGGDTQSGISGHSGMTGTSKNQDEESNIESAEVHESHSEPQVTSSSGADTSKMPNDTTEEEDSGESNTSRGPLPPLPVENNQIIVNVSNNENENVEVDMHDDYQIKPTISRQLSEPKGNIPSRDKDSKKSKSKIDPEKANQRPNTEHSHAAAVHGPDVRRPSYHRQSSSRSRTDDYHYQADHHRQAQRRVQETRSHYERQRNPPLPPRGQTSQSLNVPDPRGTHTHRKRQSRRKCEICGNRYNGQARDIVVGYIRGCGHFYHCLCIDSYIRKYGTCPRCHYEAKHGPGPIRESSITLTDVFFAFLSDMIIETAEDQPVSDRRRGRVNNGYVPEMQRRF